jgi:tetratricopeptide (TPR) repeat protein
MRSMETRSAKALLFCASAAAALPCIAPGCGSRNLSGHPVNPNKPIDRVLMEPIVIQAYEDEEGEIKFDAYDAESLFDQGLKYIDNDKPAVAVKYFEKIIKEFPDTRFIEATLFNAAYCREQLSLKKKKVENLGAAVALYDKLVTEHPGSPYVVDALFRKGYCLEDLGKTDEAIDLYTKLLERQDLKSEDKIELKARIGNLLLGENEFDKAEDELRDTILFFKEVSEDERIENSFYAAQAQFQIAEIYRSKFESIAFSTDEKEIRQEMEDKLAFMIKAKDAYVETIKIGNYPWAVASGYRVGMLLRTLYDQVMGAPIPPKVGTEELKQIYLELLDEKVRPLLESAVSVWEKTLLMAERVGYQGEWVDEIEAAMDETTAMIKP